ncbi:MBL fold metallo-hydrolase [Bacillaceae bacterium W0354]
MLDPVDLGNDISLIDLFDLKMKKRTGTYVLHDDELTIIETSASPSVPYLLEGLKRLNLDPKEVKHIIVTHIHLDHAGGVGLFLESCPQATVYVHPRGQRHLADPSKLIQSARLVYGEKFDQLFDPILPVPEDRLVAMDDGESLKLGKRTLTFYDTPGHAKHHFSIYDSLSHGIFTGDTIGVLYPIDDFDFVLPSTSPNQFDPNAMLQSLERIKRMNVEKVFFGHFGESQHPEKVYEQIQHWTPKFVQSGEKVVNEFEKASVEMKVEILSHILNEMVGAYLEEHNIPRTHDIYNYLTVDLQVCAMGIIDYASKQIEK